MAIELTRITDLLRRANKNRSNALDLKKLRDDLVEKEKAAEAALEAADKAVSAAEVIRLKLAEEVAKDEDSEAETLTEETNEQKIARLEKEIEDVKRIQVLEKQLADAKSAKSSTEVIQKEIKVTTTKVDAEKLNISSPPKATTEVYEPEAPASGAKGAAARRK